jgi:DNA-binding NarL/FixJ family response regulator
MQTDKINKVVLVDDHRLFRKGMEGLINNFSGYTVIWEAENGKEFTQKLSHQNLPDIILLDISMPIMDGFETAQWMEQRYPDVKILALSMHNDDETILKMLKSGVNGYILKNADPSELKIALDNLEKEGSYYSNKVTDILIKNFNKKKEVNVELSEREIDFLKLACSELPYKSFAPLLKVHPRVVEAIREALFKKLNVLTRVGLVLFAIRNGIYKI